MRPLIIVATIFFASFAAAKDGFGEVNFHEKRKQKGCWIKFSGICGCHEVVIVDDRNRCSKVPRHAKKHGVACGDEIQVKMRSLILLATFLFANIATANWNFDLYSKRNSCKLKVDGICGCHATVTVDSRGRCERLPGDIVRSGGACSGKWEVDTRGNRYELRFNNNHGNCKVKCTPKNGGSCGGVWA
ncbi:MAG: hypothetical protein Q9192_008717 [Flavoplaca navasiana]